MNGGAFAAFVGVGLLMAMSLPAAAISDRAEEDGRVESTFVSPLDETFDESIDITCMTATDLREDPIAVDDPVNEHLTFACDAGVGTYCDYPSWTPEPLRDPDFCGDASEIRDCHGVFFSFTGSLRIGVAEEGLFMVTYDGLYSRWEGSC